MRKKMIALMMAAALAITSLVGCSSSTDSTSSGSSSTSEVVDSTEVSNFNATGYPIVNETITLNVMICIRDQDSLVDVNDMPAIQRLEEETGIHVEWEVVKGSDWDTKFNLAMASGEYPDIIINVQSTVDYEEYGVTQGILLALDDLIEEYMPNYTERRDAETDDPTVGLVASDGQTYCVGYLVGQNICVQANYFINQSWLDALGLDTPTTVDELTDVLRAFKTGDPNGNGLADEIPLMIGLDSGYSGVQSYASLFGMPMNSNWVYIDEDKQIVFAPATENFKEYMEWLHMLYEEELVDPEILTQDWTTINTKLQGDNAGFFGAWRLTMMAYDSFVEDATIWVPSAEDGAYLPRYMEICSKGAYITCTNEYVEASMRWLNALLDTEMMFSLYYGEQDATDGTGWAYDENGMINSLSDGAERTRTWLDCNTLFFAPGYYLSDTFNMPTQRVEKTEYCQTYEAAGVVQTYSNQYLSMAPLTSDQLSALSLTETDLDKAVWEYVAIFITDGVTDSNWAAFMNVLESINYEEYVQTYQTALDQMELD